MISMNNRFYGVLTFVILAFSSAFFTACDNKETATPKYVFFFIGDGMGMPHVAATDSYLAYKDGKFGGSCLGFTSFPVTGLTRTWCANSGVTDSAAAGTALACGEKTNKSMLGMAPDSTDLVSIAYKLKEKGYQIGIMSDGPVNHATPAAYYAHVPYRSLYYEIATQSAGCGFDFLGGSEIIDRYGKDSNQQDVVEIMEAEGNCDVCFGLTELAASTASTKILLPSTVTTTADFAGKDANKDYDLENENYVIADYLKAFLSTVDTGKPFFVMAEQGYVDWSSHGNNIVKVIENVCHLDDAVRVAYEFYLQHPDETLIVVTADHETGGLTFGTKNYKTVWNALDEAKEKYGEEIPEDKLKEVDAAAHVNWSTTDHTGCPVAVYAIGKGAEKFTGYYENCELPRRILGGK